MQTTIRWLVIGLMVASTVVLFLLVLAHDEHDLETSLKQRFHPSHSDAFDGVNGTIVVLLVVHVFYSAMVIAVLIANRIIPAAIALGTLVILEGLYLATSDLADPSWHNIICVTDIGEFSGLIAGLVAFGFEIERSPNFPNRL